MHQAGADSKSSSPAETASLWSFGSQMMRHSLSTKLAQRGSGISMSIILNKTGELFVLFSFICPAPFLPLPSQPLKLSHSSYQDLGSRRRQSEKGRRFQELVFFVIYC